MAQRFDPTPLPPPRPPTAEYEAAARPTRRLLPWLLAIFASVAGGTVVILLLATREIDQQTLATARDEAAEERRAHFRLEDELRKLRAANKKPDGEIAADDSHVVLSYVEEPMFMADGQLTVHGKTVLAALGGLFKDLGDRHVQIHAHSRCAVATERAAKIVRALVDAGVDAARIGTTPCDLALTDKTDRGARLEIELTKSAPPAH